MTTELTKDQKIEQLVEWLIDSWDMSALVSYATAELSEYYASDNGEDDFEENYANMKEIMGDE
jgi:hypothetical protein